MLLRHPEKIENLHKLEDGVREFSKYLAKLSHIEKWGIWNEHIFGSQLSFIATTLDEMITDHESYAKSLRLIRDQLFTKHFNIRHKISRTQYISKIFDKFIRGITYFNDPSVRSTYPVYHRITSCGPVNDQNYTTFHRCYESNPNNDIAKQRIWTCYIERLIYDRMLKDMSLFFPVKGTEKHQQDAGHRAWINKTKDDFQTCYPNTNVFVSISRYESMMPVQLVIVIRKGKKEVERLCYTRSLETTIPFQPDYESTVTCERFLENIVQFKVQTFHDEIPWDDPILVDESTYRRNELPRTSTPSSSSSSVTKQRHSAPNLPFMYKQTARIKKTV